MRDPIEIIETEVDPIELIVSVMDFVIQKQLNIKDKKENLKLETKESLYLTIGQCNDIELKKKMFDSEFKAYEDVLFFIQKKLNK
tara:strand:+ start:51450 stop:51704 length:255 start_codon:yes stop_codon:yes gene_type:complete